MTWRVVQGDCVERTRELDECSVDAVVCDPPYGIRFMGKAWDDGEVLERRRAQLDRNAEQRGNPNAPGSNSLAAEAGVYDVSLKGNRAFQAWCTEWTAEAFRVLKPGGHLLAFGGTRTYHRLACAVEDAGFEIRDTICWLYGSGFPKSLDVSKAIDKAAGAERLEVGPSSRHGGGIVGAGSSYELPPEPHMLTAPATPEAEQWQGWGTALKPAHEPVVVARKPLSGTVAGNVLEHGVGALNVDGCRVEGPPKFAENAASRKKSYDAASGFVARAEFGGAGVGRWPANVVLDPESARLLDEQTGEVGNGWSKNYGEQYTDEGRQYGGGVFGGGGFKGGSTYADSGGASRFFYCAKASRGERNAGLEGFEEQLVQSGMGGDMPTDDQGRERDRFKTVARNVHPTVKPIELMRWLVRLVTPPGGTVLDPFTGSGTTGCACVLEGFDFIGLEREPEYVQIAEARIAWWHRHRGDGLAERVLAAGRERELVEDAGQGSLFDLDDAA